MPRGGVRLICKVPGCSKHNKSSGFCEKHWRRLIRNGTTLLQDGTEVYDRQRPRKACRVAGCSRKAVGHELCELHYRRFRRSGSTDDPVRPAPRLCSVNGCGRPYDSLGFCTLHYHRNRNGTPLSGRPHLSCSVIGCDGPHAGLGFCKKHYQRFKRHGTPDGRKAVRHCGVLGCSRPYFSTGYCTHHYYMLRTHGDPLYAPQSHSPGDRRVVVKGGIEEEFVFSPANEAAGRGGWVRLAAIVLQSIGISIVRGDRITFINGNHLDCSLANLEIGARRRILKCCVCGEPFVVYLSRKTGVHSYCSKKCLGVSMQGRVSTRKVSDSEVVAIRRLSYIYSHSHISRIFNISVSAVSLINRGVSFSYIPTPKPEMSPYEYELEIAAWKARNADQRKRQEGVRNCNGVARTVERQNVHD